MENRDRIAAVEKALEEGRLTKAACANVKCWLEGKDFSAFWPDIGRLVDAGDFDAVNEYFGNVIPFGTGGRRGPVGIGPNRINERTIGESAQGVAGYVLKHWKGESAPSVVVACDTRNTSLEFAKITAEILAGNGLRVYLFDGPRATPELSFAVRELGAEAGVVISASHNPPSDNGFKVYGKDGAQIVPPVDTAIIGEVEKVDRIRRMDLKAARTEGKLESLGSAMDHAYWDRLSGLALVPERTGIDIVFTPLHGTGLHSVKPALERVGKDRILLVESQAAPDGDFPNVPDRKPNPEEPRAMEMAVSMARERSADLVLATDPDADRLGVAVRRSADGNEMVRLNGNQIGVLLTFHILRELKKRGRIRSDGFVVKTLVTSRMIEDIARDFGVGVRTDLLVGFKYIGEVIEKDLGGSEERFIFGAEESHGYLRGTFVRDKDAATAAVLMAELTALLKEEGKTPYDLLQVLYRRYGYFHEDLKSIVLKGEKGLRRIEEMMADLRKDPPKEFGGEKVARVEDYKGGHVLDPATGRILGSIPKPKGNLLIFRLSEDGRNWLAARPSGTEPKIKFYLSVYLPVPENADLETIKQEVQEKADRIWSALPTE